MGIAVLCLWGAVFASSAAGHPKPEPKKGMFLVASESLKDPRFRQSVVLLIRFNDQGALGLIVNRPTRFVLEKVLPEAEVLTGRPDRLYFGGPVDLKAVLVLLETEKPPAASTPVFDNTHLTGIDQALEHLGKKEKANDRFRVFLGYAGWAPGQLQAEIARGDWQLVPAEEDILFRSAPSTLWQELRETLNRVWI
jgi:putative transcriptional regulator